MFKTLDTVLDRWAAMDFKPKFSNIITPVNRMGWVGDEDTRRLRAYGLLDAYAKNKSRIWIGTQPSIDDASIKDRREYGESALLINTALSSLLGDEWSITTLGAMGTPIDGINQAGAIAQQQYLHDWADKEKFSLKLIESETQSIKFGDSVYAIGFDRRKGRPCLYVYDPGFYFPVLDEKAGGAEDFPREVAIAWEYDEETIDGRMETYVRRMEWILVELDEDVETCMYRSASWKMDQAVDGFVGTPWEVFTESEDPADNGWVDLEIDFIPVVHVPNTVSLQEHFGESILTSVLQILDDVQSTDTDLQAAAATTGSPPIAVTGLGNDTLESYGPGTVIRTGDGTASIVDTSRSLDALLKLKDALLERLAVNSRTPESLLGRVKPNEVPSGIALTLSFTPHSGMIKGMRLVRDYKYRMLLKFVLRIAQKNGALPEGDIYESRIHFGSFLPADAQEAMLIVTQLLESKAISLETAIKILIERGYPIEDYVEEIERITSRDIEFANGVFTLTGNAEYAASLLKIPAIQVIGLEDDIEEEDPLADE